MSFRSASNPANPGLETDPASDAFSFIDRHSTVDGSLSSAHDVRVEGRVLGSVTCEGTLFVAEGAEVDATVEAGGIVIAGTLLGTVRCKGRLEIRASGVVRGKVETSRLMIEEGALYEGQLKMDAPASVTEPPAEAEEQAPAEQAATSGGPANAYSFLRSFSQRSPSIESGDDLPASDDEREPDPH